MPASFVLDPDPDEHHHEDDPRPALRKEAAKKVKHKAPTKDMRYVSLHHHSTFSFLDGFQMPDAHVRRAADLRMSALALTEHGNISSHVKLEMAAQEHGVKPIFGVELYCGGVDDETKTQRKNHLTILAENQVGYSNLMRTVTDSWSDYYYEPTTSGANLAKHKKGLIVMSGCTGSLLSTSLIGGKNVAKEDASYEAGLAVAKRFHKTFGDGYYLEVQAFPELEDVCRLNVMVAEISAVTGIPLVASGDCHYTTPEESEIQQILHNVRGGSRQTLEQQAQAWGYDVPLAPPASDYVILERLVATGLTKRQAVEAIENTAIIAERCNVELPKMPLLRFPLPAGYKDTPDVWHRWLREGWEYRGIKKLPKDEIKRYRAQLKKEMDIIEVKDYVDYFLIVSDIVKFSKDAGIPVGPARGSAAASLVCYLLRITEVNPMLFPNLVFERFIDVTREDLPDIDLDFDSNRRYEVEEYAAAKYGRSHVAKIGSFVFFKSKNSLDDVARAHRIPQFEVNKIKEVLVERSSGDLRASATIEETVELFEAAADVVERYPKLRHSMDLEGNVKGLGVHAAGLVIANQPISDVTAIYSREVRGELTAVVGLDKYDTERQGLLKIDVLGLSTMSLIADCLKMTGLTLDDLYSIPLDDQLVIQAFHTNDNVGIFQFDGRAMGNITQSLRPDSFGEVCDINALARPGPLHSGSTARYIDAKHGRLVAEPIHESLRDITESTHHQIVYQEQILRIVREVGNFDWTHAAYIRKIISKKLGEQEFERQFAPFRDGAIANGLTAEEARNVWNNCITAGTYAFNAAHCVSYGLLAWWTMWLKIHHTAEFYCAALTHLNKDKHIELLKDARKHGVEALPPSPTASGVSWSVTDDGNIQGGFSQIHGIGDKVAQKIVDCRKAENITTWPQLEVVPGIGAKTIDKIIQFTEQEDPYKIDWLHNRIEGVIAELPNLGLPMVSHRSQDIPYEAHPKDMLVRWAGVVTQRNQKDLFEMHFSRTGEELDPVTTRDPHLREWVVAYARDDHDFVTCTINRWNYSRFRKAIWSVALEDDVVVFEGIKRGRDSRRAIDVRKMWILKPDA
jgi:DNA polymerase-3 subunit alpha